MPVILNVKIAPLPLTESIVTVASLAGDAPPRSVPRIVKVTLAI